MSNVNTAPDLPIRTNGVDVGQLTSVIDAVERDADYGKFQFRVSNDWQEGGLNRSRIKEYYAECREDVARTKAFIVDADEPAVSGGGDSAPNPMEWVLHSLVSCRTSTMVYHAAVQGIEIRSVQSSLTGDMDVRGMLGLSEEVRKGYSHVQVRMLVDSDENAATLKELALFSPADSL